MPSKQEHITKADGHAAFARSLPLDKQSRIEIVAREAQHAASQGIRHGVRHERQVDIHAGFARTP